MGSEMCIRDRLQQVILELVLLVLPVLQQVLLKKLRQILPVLAMVHGRGVVHGDVNPRNLLRRDVDGLPVLLDFGLIQAIGDAPLAGATAGYAPRSQGRQDAAATWMDLHGLGVTALVLLSGKTPEGLIDVSGADWLWPEGLELDPAFRAVLDRLISESFGQRFESVQGMPRNQKELVWKESSPYSGSHEFSRKNKAIEGGSCKR